MVVVVNGEGWIVLALASAGSWSARHLDKGWLGRQRPEDARQRPQLAEEAQMSALIDHLKRFNRKERFILLSHVLGPVAEEAFRINPYFAGKLAAKLGLEIPKRCVRRYGLPSRLAPSGHVVPEV